MAIQWYSFSKGYELVMKNSLKSQIQLTKEYNEFRDFKADVLKGLSRKDKTLSSKYFYDKKGSALYNKITQHKDYYLTNCELEILNENKQYLSQLFDQRPINLIELGPGEGTKTAILLQQFKEDSLECAYYPIDISDDYLTNLEQKLSREIPGLNIIGIKGDFFTGLRAISKLNNKQNLLLFLGSSIGNLELNATKDFFKAIWSMLNNDDYVLIGFDFRKEIQTLIKAYDDDHFLTRDFNLNLLDRINRELMANFNRSFFEHYALYNPRISAMESYILSTRPQLVYIKALDKSFSFDAYEGIHVEFSHKYTLKQIHQFAIQAGFEEVKNFVDSKCYFVDALWRVKK